MFNSLSQFYTSQDWRNFRAALIAKRISKADGILYCEECGKPIINSYEIIAHHIQPLTMANVNNYAVSLSGQNISLVHIDCHNAIHKRFGFCTERKVYLITGAPLSGKTTFVKEHKGNSDIVVDMDSIWQCITGGARYEKPNALKQNAFAVRDCLIDMIKTRAGKWETAFVIEGLPRKGERERKAAFLGAEVIHIDTDKKTCYSRLQTDTGRKELQEQWRKYIDDYFSQYQE